MNQLLEGYLKKLNNIKYKTEFVIMEHHAKKAGLHYDLRYRLPNSKMWASFAIPKGIPQEDSKQKLAIRTNDHSEQEAKLTGDIEDGYGAGLLKLWDSGKCTILKNKPNHIIIDFEGKKIKGVYHLLKPENMKKKDHYFIYKAKDQDKYRRK